MSTLPIRQLYLRRLKGFRVRAILSLSRGAAAEMLNIVIREL